MATDIKAPDFPESVEEGTLSEWLKQNGDTVDRDEKIAAVETDKIVLDVYALEAGTLNILIEEGETVPRGAVLARIAGGSNGSKKAAAKKPAAPAAKAAAPAPVAAPAAPPAPAAPAPAPVAAPASVPSLSPSVRQLVTEHNLDPATIATITGTGKGGRILKADVLRHIETGSAAAAAPAPRPSATPPTAAAGDLPERRVPMSRIRATIARRLKEVQNTAAILTTFNEVNMKPVMDIRARYKENFLKEYGVKLGFMSFFTKAVCEALKKYPAINASVDGDDIIYHEYYNVSIAIDSPRGLVVPVIQHADLLSFAEIERTIRQLAEKAREGKLAYADLVGGTFTITNGGTFGSMLSTPILNAPQSAILGMHNIVQRPWVENGEVVVRPVMYLALSYDHRVIDGSTAVRFLVSIKESLENPEKLLLQL